MAIQRYESDSGGTLLNIHLEAKLEQDRRRERASRLARDRTFQLKETEGEEAEERVGRRHDLPKRVHIAEEVEAFEQMKASEPKWTIDALRIVPAEPQRRDIPNAVMAGGVLFQADKLPIPSAGGRNGFQGRLTGRTIEYLTRDRWFGNNNRYGREIK